MVCSLCSETQGRTTDTARRVEWFWGLRGIGVRVLGLWVRYVKRYHAVLRRNGYPGRNEKTRGSAGPAALGSLQNPLSPESP